MNTSRGFASIGLILLLVIGLVAFAGAGWWATRHVPTTLNQAVGETASTTNAMSQATPSPYANTVRMGREQDALTLGDVSSQPSEPYSIAGWTIRSRSTGFIYTVPAIVYTKNSYKGVPAVSTSSPVMMYPGSGEFIVIHSGGGVSDNLVHETEIVAYHLYTGTTSAWAAHDTIGLFDARGLLVSHLTY